MAQVWNALNSLSQTVGNRGGISDAMLRGADASLGLKRAEYEIARGQKADEMAKKNFEYERPEKELRAQKAQKRLELVPVRAQEIFPQDIGGITHTLTPRSGDGKSLYDDLDKGLPGSGWNEKGHRVNKDGAEVMIPRWQLEEQYLPSSMALYTARMDPIKKLNDKLFEIDESLKTVDPNDQEYQTIKGKSDLIKKTLSDPNQLAPLYAKKASLLQDQIAWGMANNVRPDFINIMKSEADKAEANFQKYGTKMTPEQRQLHEADLNAKKADVEMKKAHADYYKAAAGKAGRSGGGGKPESFANRMKMGEAEVERFTLRHGIESDPVSGKIKGADMSPEDAEKIRADGKRRGLEVYFNKNTVEDTGSGLNPFDNKKVERYSITGIVPSNDFGLQAGDESEEAPSSSNTMDIPDLALDINTKAPDMSLRDIVVNLKNQKVDGDTARKIAKEIQAIRTQKGTGTQKDPKPTERRKPTKEELDALDDEQKRKEVAFIKGVIPNFGARIKSAAERDRNALATHMGR